MFKATCTIWHQLPLEIPFHFVEDLLSLSSSKQTIGLQILDIFIANKMISLDDERMKKLYDTLLHLLSLEDRRKVVRQAAVLCGSILSQTQDTEFEKKIGDLLSSWHAKKKTDNFIYVLYDVSSRYQEILKRFASINLGLLSALYGTFKVRLSKLIESLL